MEKNYMEGSMLPSTDDELLRIKSYIKLLLRIKSEKIIMSF